MVSVWKESFSSSLTKWSLLSVLTLLLPVPVSAAAGILTNLLTEGAAVALSSRVFSGNGSMKQTARLEFGFGERCQGV